MNTCFNPFFPLSFFKIERMKTIYLILVLLLISTTLVDWTDCQITSIALAFSPALAGAKLLGLAGLAALAGAGGNNNQGR